MSEEVAYKLLALLNPDHPEIRERFGLEAPAFVSPHVYAGSCEGIRCDRCAAVIRPLLYQVGRETRSIHARGCQGIFHVPAGKLPTLLRVAGGASPFLCWGVLRDGGAAFEPLAINVLPRYRTEESISLSVGRIWSGFYLVPYDGPLGTPSPWAVEFRDGVPLFTREAAVLV